MLRSYRGKGSQAETVTYGSVVRLTHQPTKTNLFSAKLSWGTQPNHQIVTSVPDSTDDDNCYWMVKQDHKFSVNYSNPILAPSPLRNSKSSAATTGSPVLCNGRIRLEHMATRRNLFSHSASSILSRKNAEVSAFGDTNSSEEGNDFIVECKKDGEQVWTTATPVRLRHSKLNNYLVSSSKIKFTAMNCPKCPVIGHQEVSVLWRSSPTSQQDTFWNAHLVLALENFEEEKERHPEQFRDEL